MAKLTEAEIKRQLSGLLGWALESGVLKKEFKFKSFDEAMKFMNTLAIVAQKLNHHPDWSNSYNKVFISLTTHSAGGITQKDFEFAKAADKAA